MLVNIATVTTLIVFLENSLFCWRSKQITGKLQIKKKRDFMYQHIAKISGTLYACNFPTTVESSKILVQYSGSMVR